jgi:hypothetical protein
MENQKDTEFIQGMLELKKKILTEMARHQDDREKKIGDRVIIWDWSANIDKRTGESRSGFSELADKEGIIIETDCGIEDKPFAKKTYICDVLIKFPDGEEVYCASSMIKRTDNHSN